LIWVSKRVDGFLPDLHDFCQKYMRKQSTKQPLDASACVIFVIMWDSLSSCSLSSGLPISASSLRKWKQDVGGLCKGFCTGWFKRCVTSSNISLIYIRFVIHHQIWAIPQRCLLCLQWEYFSDIMWKISASSPLCGFCLGALRGSWKAEMCFVFLCLDTPGFCLCKRAWSACVWRWRAAPQTAGKVSRGEKPLQSSKRRWH